LRFELNEKNKEFDELKRSVQLSKQKEAESDVQVYIDECSRLRSVLE